MGSNTFALRNNKQNPFISFVRYSLWKSILLSYFWTVHWYSVSNNCTYLLKGKVDKQNNKLYFIDVIIPGDAHIKMKTTEKLDKYRDLQIIIQQVWSMLISIIPIVIGALGSVSLDHSKWLKVLDLSSDTATSKDCFVRDL